MTNALYDIFISHGFREHDEWRTADQLFQDYEPVSFRNFSLPWFDPALDANDDLGYRLIFESLENQIIPADFAILLTSVAEASKARRWFETELNLLKIHGTLIIALPKLGEEAIPETVQNLAHTNAQWSVESILKAFESAKS